MEVFYKLLETIEKSSIDNKVTIENVELFVQSWKREAESLQLRKTDVSGSVLDKNKGLIKSMLIYDFEKHEKLGGQQCGMPVNAIIVKSIDLDVEIKVKHFKQNYRNKEFAGLLMDLAIDELVK